MSESQPPDHWDKRGCEVAEELASRPVSPVRIARRVPPSRPPPVPGTHAMALCPSSVPLRVPLPAPSECSLPKDPDPDFDRARAASPTVSRLLASAVIDPSFESAAASALVGELLYFAAPCHLDYATALVAESASTSPPSIEAPPSDESVEPSGPYPELVGCLMYLMTCTRPDLVYPLSLLARYVARDRHQKVHRDAVKRVLRYLCSTPGMGLVLGGRGPVVLTGHVDAYWILTAPSSADPLLFLCTDTSLPLFYVLVYVNDLCSTANNEALAHVKSELQKRHTCTDLGELRSYIGLQITRDRARRTITLTQSHMVYQVLQHFGFQFSSPQPTPLSTSHSLSAPPSNESVEPSGLYPELVGCLMYLMTCTRPDLAYPLSLLALYVGPGRHRKVHWDAAKRVLRFLCSTLGMVLVLGGRGPVVLTGHADASWVDESAMQRSSQGYTFSLGSGSVSWRSTRSSSVLSSSFEAEIYTGAMAAQELCWLTYLLTDSREQPRFPPVLYVDNKAMIALCQEHSLEQRT
ncbi:unnamed protein product [Closterium sp. NIES-54]